MKDTALELTLLYDRYCGMLTEKQQTCFDLYYNQDLSLSEIAEESGISRQGVHDTLNRTEAALRGMEQQLGCVEKERRLQSAVLELRWMAEELEQNAPDMAKRIRHVAEQLEKE